MSPDVPATRPKRRRPVSYLRSNFYAQPPTLPGPDTPVGAIIAERRASLVADLGGVEACSTAQLCMIDMVIASWALLDSVSAYLISLPSPVDRRHRRVWQVVRDREALAGRLQSLLRDLGLERRARDVQLDVLAELARQASAPPATPAPGSDIARVWVPSTGAVSGSPPISGSGPSPDAGGRDEG